MSETLGWFIISGQKYPCPLPDTLKFGEAHFIQQATGQPALQAGQLMAAGDTDAFAAFCIVAMRRAGKKTTLEEFYELELGAIAFEVAEDQEPEQGPPPAGASGADSNASLDGSSAMTPETPGTPRSVTSSA